MKNTKADHAKPPLWTVVAKCMEENTLDLLREGKLNINFKGEKVQGVSSKATTTDANKENSEKKKHGKDSKGDSQKDKSNKRDKNGNKKEKRSHEKHDVPKTNVEDDDESDGGFFE